MYGKYTLFYESPKNWGYYAHAQTVCTRPLLGGEGPGDEASPGQVGGVDLMCVKPHCLAKSRNIFDVNYGPSSDQEHLCGIMTV